MCTKPTNLWDTHGRKKLAGWAPAITVTARAVGAALWLHPQVAQPAARALQTRLLLGGKLSLRDLLAVQEGSD